MCEEPSENIEHSSVGRQSLNPKEILVISMCNDQIIFKFIICLRFYFQKTRENRGRKNIREVIADNFLYLMENINLHIEEAQRTLSSINSKRVTPHIS